MVCTADVSASQACWSLYWYRLMNLSQCWLLSKFPVLTVTWLLCLFTIPAEGVECKQFILICGPRCEVFVLKSSPLVRSQQQTDTHTHQTRPAAVPGPLKLSVNTVCRTDRVFALCSQFVHSFTASKPLVQGQDIRHPAYSKLPQWRWV